MCVNRYCVLFLFLLAPLLAVSQQRVSVPLSMLENLRQEAALIRKESAALKNLLALSMKDLTDLRNRLARVETALSRAEALLAEASLNLEQSEAALLLLREDLAKLGIELAELKKQACESNRRFQQLQKEKRFWKIAAISVAAVFTVVEVGRGLAK